MAKRNVFYTFHYKLDNWRASQVRNIGAVEGNEPASDNEWEKVKQGGDTEIMKWIAQQMKGRSCTVVLVGSGTANRKWINYEIAESRKKGMGIVGIYIHNLKDSSAQVTKKGDNPFDYVRSENGVPLSTFVKCYDPRGSGSKECYRWIEENLADIIEKAI